MRVSGITLLLAVVQVVLGAAVRHIRQAGDANSISTLACEAASAVTTTIVQTVTAPALTVTIASEDSAAIASTLSSWASMDSAQVSYLSEEAPTAEGPVTTDNIFTYTVVVPVVEATLATSNTSSADYVFAGPNTTNWSYTPTQESAVIDTTTLTVDPEPASATSPAVPTTTILQTIYESHTLYSTLTSSVHTALPWAAGGSFPPYASSGWNSTQGNATQSNSSVVVSAVGSDVATTVIVQATTTISTITFNGTAQPSPGPDASPSDNCTETHTSTSTANLTDHAVKKRQVCTLVSASFWNGWASWCNNWDGSRTLTGTETLWTSTYVAGATPVSITPQSSAAPVSLSSPSSSPPPASPTQPGSVTFLPPPPSSTVVPPTSTVAQTSSPAAPPAASSSCGASGAFEINFDNLPAYSPPNNATTLYPEIFNPYDNFFWADGWTYVPPPNEDIFPPQSGSHLGMFIPTASNIPTTSPDAGNVPVNAFGAGPRAASNTWWFDATSVYVGCNNSDPSPATVCNFVATGYKWDPVAQKESVAVTHVYPQASCPYDIDCRLREIYFSPAYTGLTSLSFYADVNGAQVTFWIDTIELSWYNNTCAAGLTRISQK